MKARAREVGQFEARPGQRGSIERRLHQVDRETDEARPGEIDAGQVLSGQCAPIPGRRDDTRVGQVLVANAGDHAERYSAVGQQRDARASVACRDRQLGIDQIAVTEHGAGVVEVTDLDAGETGRRLRAQRGHPGAVQGDTVEVRAGDRRGVQGRAEEHGAGQVGAAEIGTVQVPAPERSEQACAAQIGALQVTCEGDAVLLVRAGHPALCRGGEPDVAQRAGATGAVDMQQFRLGDDLGLGRDPRWPAEKPLGGQIKRTPAERHILGSPGRPQTILTAEQHRAARTHHDRLRMLHHRRRRRLLACYTSRSPSTVPQTEPPRRWGPQRRPSAFARTPRRPPAGWVVSWTADTGPRYRRHLPCP